MSDDEWAIGGLTAEESAGFINAVQNARPRQREGTGMKQLREHVGWLIWCMSEGYITREDRLVSEPNWLLDDNSTLTDDDIQTKAGLLVMADEVLAEIAKALFVDDNTEPE